MTDEHVVSRNKELRLFSTFYDAPDSLILWDFMQQDSVNVVMETKGGKKKSSSSSSSRIHYEAPLGYIIEDVRPNGGIEKFRSAAYSNVNPYELFICL